MKKCYTPHPPLLRMTTGCQHWWESFKLPFAILNNSSTNPSNVSQTHTHIQVEQRKSKQVHTHTHTQNAKNIHCYNNTALMESMSNLIRGDMESFCSSFLSTYSVWWHTASVCSVLHLNKQPPHTLTFTNAFNRNTSAGSLNSWSIISFCLQLFHHTHHLLS